MVLWQDVWLTTVCSKMRKLICMGRQKGTLKVCFTGSVGYGVTGGALLVTCVGCPLCGY